MFYQVYSFVPQYLEEVFQSNIIDPFIGPHHDNSNSRDVLDIEVSELNILLPSSFSIGSWGSIHDGKHHKFVKELLKWPPVDEMCPNFACRELLEFRFQKYMIGGHPASSLQFLLSGLHLSICYTLEVRYVLDNNI